MTAGEEGAARKEGEGEGKDNCRYKYELWEGVVESPREGKREGESKEKSRGWEEEEEAEDGSELYKKDSAAARQDSRDEKIEEPLRSTSCQGVGSEESSCNVWRILKRFFSLITPPNIILFPPPALKSFAMCSRRADIFSLNFFIWRESPPNKCFSFSSLWDNLRII